MVQRYSIRKKRHLQRNKRKEETKTKKAQDKTVVGNCVWLSGRTHKEGRITIERRAAASVKQKNKNETKQKQR